MDHSSEQQETTTVRDSEQLDQHTKACRDCNQTKPVAEFYAEQKPNGRVYYKPICKQCHYIRDKEARQARRNGPVVVMPKVKAKVGKPIPAGQLPLDPATAVKLAQTIVDANAKMVAMESDLTEARKMLAQLQSDYDTMMVARDDAIRAMVNTSG